jgi:anti-sigma B factor antagonist
MSAHLEVSWRREASVLELRGDLDPASAPDLRAQVTTLIEAGTTGFKVDMSGVEFIDSSGLRELLRIDDQLKEHDERLVLLRPSEVVSTLLSMTGLDQRLTIEV